MLTIVHERNSSDLFMKVALVKVKVKSSAAFRGIVARRNNITVSRGSCAKEQDDLLARRKEMDFAT